MSDIVLLRQWMESQVEFWRPLVEYPGYDVSNFGRMRSWRTVTRLHGTAGGTTRTVRTEALIMKTRRNNQGYCNFAVRTLDRDRIISKRAHRLVAGAFTPNPLGLPHVNHRNGIKDDNRVDNLEWISQRDNIRHAFASGLYKRGQHYALHGMMYNVYVLGMSKEEIVRMTGYTWRRVDDILRKKKLQFADAGGK